MRVSYYLCTVNNQIIKQIINSIHKTLILLCDITFDIPCNNIFHIFLIKRLVFIYKVIKYVFILFHFILVCVYRGPIRLENDLFCWDLGFYRFELFCYFFINNSHLFHHVASRIIWRTNTLKIALIYFLYVI